MCVLSAALFTLGTATSLTVDLGEGMRGKRWCRGACRDRKTLNVTGREMENNKDRIREKGKQLKLASSLNRKSYSLLVLIFLSLLLNFLSVNE